MCHQRSLHPLTGTRRLPAENLRLLTQALGRHCRCRWCSSLLSWLTVLVCYTLVAWLVACVPRLLGPGALYMALYDKVSGDVR